LGEAKRTQQKKDGFTPFNPSYWQNKNSFKKCLNQEKTAGYQLSEENLINY